MFSIRHLRTYSIQVNIPRNSSICVEKNLSSERVQANVEIWIFLRAIGVRRIPYINDQGTRRNTSAVNSPVGRATKYAYLLIMIRVVIVEIAICQDIRKVRGILAETLGCSLEHFESIGLVLQVLGAVDSDVEGAAETVSWSSWRDDVVVFELGKILLHVIMAESY
jgi:hypothetical protein